MREPEHAQPAPAATMLTHCTCGDSVARMMRRSLNVCALLVAVAALAGCPPTYPKCDNDKDCHAGEFCVNGTCQQCRNDKDCPAGQSCNKGRCEAPPATSCTDDSQCPAGQSCIDGTCKACVSDDQCGPGGKCNQGRCQRAATPTTSNEGAGACSLEAVYFDFNESVLSTDATSAIDRDAECAKKNGTRSLTLTGHTDPRGTEEYNLALSDHRAQSVKDRMQRVGVTASMKTVARGKMDASGTDEQSWAKDRRVDVQ
jgi:peptidoglycan-associated lipoprotein